MNTERDKFLTEAMGECWHDSLGKEIYDYAECQHLCVCSKCNAYTESQNDFSTWKGFGKLWEWCQKQEWWYDFCYNTLPVDHSFVNPNKFADAVYENLLYVYERIRNFGNYGYREN